MNIWTNQYHPSGYLIKIIFDAQFIGYSCLHTWPELGDKSAKEHLLDFKKAEFSDVIKQVIYFAQIDAKAKAEKIKLYEMKNVPQSHLLLQNLNDIPHTLADNSTVKIKLGQNLEKEFSELNASSEVINRKKLKIRFDFNSRVPFENVINFLTTLNKQSVLFLIDAIEDPCTFNKEHWLEIKNRFGVKLAADRERAGYGVADIIVIKPTIQNTDALVEYAINENKKIYFTSNLDHALGVTSARFDAARINAVYPGLVLASGLNFALNQQPEYSGFGFGFDKTFEKLKWDFLL